MMNKKVQKQIDNSLQVNSYNKRTGSVGTILSYDRYSNSASVLLSKPETDEIEEVLQGVPCPTYIGVQMAAPEPGRLCWIVFKNGNLTQPLITHYYNHRYDMFDYSRQTVSGVNTPSYMLG